MQDYSWNDLRYLLALGRTGTLSAASRQIGVNETTVSRRIKDLAARMGVDLFVRGTSGRFEPTEAALKILEFAERVEQENLKIQETIGQAGSDLFGVVRITSVPMITNRLLVPHLGNFCIANPGITLELVVDSRNLDLSKREADLALRFARPTAGGLKINAQKLGALEFAVYGPATMSSAEAHALPWIGYEDQQAGLPQARWLAAAIQRSDMRQEPLRVSDVETAFEAVAAGLGKSLLPRAIALQDPRLQELTEETAEALPQRDIWLLSHVDQGRRSVAVTKEWLSTFPWPSSM
jgi:DNA-binding transcriptional LysR family regulator